MPDYDKKAKVIQDFIEELEINILAMVSNRHSFIEKIINEPVVKIIGFHPKVPFLVITQNELITINKTIKLFKSHLLNLKIIKMKNTGIWLDKEKALIIKLNNDEEDLCYYKIEYRTL